MCPNISANKKSSEYKSDNSKNFVEHNLTTLSCPPEVCLQTLRVKLYNGSRCKVVRVIIDTASHRSYICTVIVRIKELGYVPHENIQIQHSLFGGVKSNLGNHGLVRLHMRSMDDTYACNFKALTQKVICETVPNVKNDV